MFGTVFAIISGMRRMTMKKSLVLIAALVILIPALAYSNTLTLRAGYFFPRAQGGPDSLWNIEFQQMSFKKADFRETILGFSYEYFLTKELSMALSVDTYSKRKAGMYNDYAGYTVDNEDWAFANEDIGDISGNFAITHGFNVSITPIELSLKLMPLGRKTRLIPYVGGGVSMLFWSASLRGSIINFDEPSPFLDANDNEIIGYPIQSADLRENNRITFGYHAFGGLMFPIGNRITLEAEFRYRIGWGQFKDAFLDFEDFDLSGFSLTAGFNYWF
jgi:opacity protein-like surface antigen